MSAYSSIGHGSDDGSADSSTLRLRSKPEPMIDASCQDGEHSTSKGDSETSDPPRRQSTRSKQAPKRYQDFSMSVPISTGKRRKRPSKPKNATLPTPRDDTRRSTSSPRSVSKKNHLSIPSNLDSSSQQGRAASSEDDAQADKVGDADLHEFWEDRMDRQAIRAVEEADWDPNRNYDDFEGV